MLQLRAASLADTHAIAAGLASLARPGDVIVLAGEMGAGKTAFAQGFGRALGITDPITSPTFTLVHSYDIVRHATQQPGGPNRGIRLFHHADLYRLERTAEVADLALDELAEFGGVVLIEWGDVVEGVFGDHLTVYLDANIDANTDADIDVATDTDSENADGEHAETDPDDDADVLSLDGRRIIDLSATGESWAARWERLTRLMETYR